MAKDIDYTATEKNMLGQVKHGESDLVLDELHNLDPASRQKIISDINTNAHHLEDDGTLPKVHIDFTDSGSSGFQGGVKVKEPSFANEQERNEYHLNQVASDLLDREYNGQGDNSALRWGNIAPGQRDLVIARMKQLDQEVRSLPGGEKSSPLNWDTVKHHADQGENLSGYFDRIQPPQAAPTDAHPAAPTTAPTDAHLSAPPAPTDAHPTAPPAPTDAHPTAPPAPTDAHLSAPPAPTDAHLAAPPAPTDAHLSAPPAPTDAHLSAPPAPTDAHLSAPPAPTDAHPTAPPAPTDAHPTAPPAPTDAHPTAPPAPTDAHLSAPPAPTDAHLAAPPAPTDAHLSAPPAPTDAHLSAPPAPTDAHLTPKDTHASNSTRALAEDAVNEDLFVKSKGQDNVIDNTDPHHPNKHVDHEGPYQVLHRVLEGGHFSNKEIDHLAHILKEGYRKEHGEHNIPSDSDKDLGKLEGTPANYQWIDKDSLAALRQDPKFDTWYKNQVDHVQSTQLLPLSESSEASTPRPAEAPPPSPDVARPSDTPAPTGESYRGPIPGDQCVPRPPEQPYFPTELTAPGLSGLYRPQYMSQYGDGSQYQGQYGDQAAPQNMGNSYSDQGAGYPPSMLQLGGQGDFGLGRRQFEPEWLRHREEWLHHEEQRRWDRPYAAPTNHYTYQAQFHPSIPQYRSPAMYQAQFHSPTQFRPSAMHQPHIAYAPVFRGGFGGRRR